jgi:peptide-methionine (S)-S-oxide reductase
MQKKIHPLFNRFSACFIVLALLLTFYLMAEDKTNSEKSENTTTLGELCATEKATFGAGCFWCVEAVFESLEGVETAVSGYMGGATSNPTYEEICTGMTGHAEVIQVTYDPDVISYEALLKRFWVAHDPTTLNRQGADMGTQYRSAIFTHTEAQAEIAESSKAEAASRFEDAIVTEISRARTFYPAENYHQDFYRNNGRHPYCQMVIKPKLKKLDGEGATID